MMDFIYLFVSWVG